MEFDSPRNIHKRIIFNDTMPNPVYCGSQVKELPLPEQVTLVSIKRGAKMIIPRGRHYIEAGDVLTLFGQLDEIDQLKESLK